MLIIDIILVLLTFATGFLSIGGETWRADEKRLIDRFTTRGKLSVMLLGSIFAFGVAKEVLNAKERAQMEAVLEGISSSQGALISRDEFALVELGRNIELLRDRIGQPAMRTPISHLFCDMIEVEYSRWTDLVGSKVQTISSTNNGRIVAYRFHTARQVLNVNGHEYSAGKTLHEKTRRNIDGEFYYLIGPKYVKSGMYFGSFGATNHRHVIVGYSAMPRDIRIYMGFNGVQATEEEKRYVNERIKATGILVISDTLFDAMHDCLMSDRSLWPEGPEEGAVIKEFVPLASLPAETVEYSFFRISP
jgi:hypothetical protein